VSGPLVLAVESSGTRSAVALLAGERLLAEEEFVRGSGGRGSGSPAAAADRALASSGKGPGDVELVAASIGPGSYTGLRVGVSFAKCFSWALGAPVAAVPSLLALAEEVEGESGVLVPTANAFRGQVFARAFRCGSDGPPVELTPDLVLCPEELGPALAGVCGPEEKVLILGSGAARWEEQLRAGLTALPGADIRGQPDCPRALTVGRIGLRMAAAGKTVTAHDLVPVYLRKTEAEERLEQPESGGPTG
jgi:tRNA threonylcarbamoyladenosine biosynthesis protein TsaB